MKVTQDRVYINRRNEWVKRITTDESGPYFGNKFLSLSHIYLLFCILISLISYPATADSPAMPRPYKTEIGKFIFVMMPGMCDQGEVIRIKMTKEEAADFKSNFKSPEYRKNILHADPDDPCSMHAGGYSATGTNPVWVGTNIRKWKITEYLNNKAGQEYPFSGLYLNDGSVTPLWTVKWYAFNTIPHIEGKYLVRMGPWASNVNQLAVAFYENGKLIKEYMIKDLVGNSDKLARTVSHFFWRKDVNMNQESKKLRIKTLTDETYIFDIQTGDIIDKESEAIPVYNVKVIRKPGTEEKLSKFESCGGIAFLQKLKKGSKANLAFYVYSNSQSEEKGVKNIVTLPFEDIEKAVNSNVQNDDKMKWNFYTRNQGKVFTFDVDNLTSYCGFNQDNKNVTIKAKEINEIIFK